MSMLRGLENSTPRGWFALAFVLCLLCLQQRLAGHVHANEYAQKDTRSEMVHACALCILKAAVEHDLDLPPAVGRLAPPLWREERMAGAGSQRLAAHAARSTLQARGPPRLIEL